MSLIDPVLTRTRSHVPTCPGFQMLMPKQPSRSVPLIQRSTRMPAPSLLTANICRSEGPSLSPVIHPLGWLSLLRAIRISLLPPSRQKRVSRKVAQVMCSARDLQASGHAYQQLPPLWEPFSGSAPSAASTPIRPITPAQAFPLVLSAGKVLEIIERKLQGTHWHPFYPPVIQQMLSSGNS